jgi:phage terminase Nu1 subunit (DNA packaging protein)
MKAILALEKMSFASCMRVARLLKILPEVARRDFVLLPMSKINLTRREIFRGKILRRKNQTKQTDLEERTQPAPKK